MKRRYDYDESEIKMLIKENLLRKMIRNCLLEGIGAKNYGSVMEFLKDLRDKLRFNPLQMGNVLKKIYYVYNNTDNVQGAELEGVLKVLLGTFNQFNTDDNNRNELADLFGLKGRDQVREGGDLSKINLNSLYTVFVKHYYNGDKKLFEEEMLRFVNHPKVNLDGNDSVSSTRSIQGTKRAGDSSGLKLLKLDIIKRYLEDSEFDECSNYINNAFRNATDNVKIAGDIGSLKITLQEFDQLQIDDKFMDIYEESR